MKELPPLPLPEGITSRMIKTGTGLTHHVLEAGDPTRPLLLLLHGFPELAFSWRKVMVPLARAGFHVIAPDQRGYGRTTGWTGEYDDDLSAFSLPCLVRDMVALVHALGREQVHALIGHDFGAIVTPWAALMRPDVFPRIACLSAPFGGPPGVPPTIDPVHEALLALDPPRKHYQWYYSTREAAHDMLEAPQGFHAFMRAYFHMKSADWVENKPYQLEGWTADQLALMPTYYVMQASETMAETVAPHDPANGPHWLPDSDMAIYAAEFSRTGMQGALNWYRCATSERFQRDLSVFHGRKIDVPTTFISGAQDWGWAQKPGALEKMEQTACADYQGTYLIDGAGHWVQQEQPEQTVCCLLEFLR